MCTASSATQTTQVRNGGVSPFSRRLPNSIRDPSGPKHRRAGSMDLEHACGRCRHRGWRRCRAPCVLWLAARLAPRLGSDLLCACTRDGRAGEKARGALRHLHEMARVLMGRRRPPSQAKRPLMRSRKRGVVLALSLGPAGTLTVTLTLPTTPTLRATLSAPLAASTSRADLCSLRPSSLGASSI